MSHSSNETSHKHPAGASALSVIFSLFLFFGLTVAGHYVFALGHGKSGMTGFVLQKQDPHKSDVTSDHPVKEKSGARKDH